MKTLLAAVLTLLAVAGFTSPARADSGLERFYRQQVRWTGCADPELDRAGLRCAEITVPLDYRAPRGRTITVTISRLAATDPARRRGILQTNPGGPGGFGLDMPIRVRAALTPEAAARYDLIGMDTRGLGRSSPLDCGLRSSIWLRSAGLDRRGFDETAALARDEARRCREKYPDLLPHITSRNIARDLDLVRGALRERKTSFLGQSYGAYLGAVYAQLFGRNLDRLVLDSAPDPRRVGVGLFRDMGPANEKAVDEFAAWAAGRDSRLGSTPDQVRGLLERLVRDAAAEPLRIGGYRVDEHTLPYVFYLHTTDERQNERLAETVRTLAGAAAGEPVTPSPELLDLLDFLARPVRGAAQNAATLAVLCGDQAAPADPESSWHAVQHARVSQPLFGPLLNSIMPCAYWGPPAERATEIGNRVPALLLQATRDTRTPYADGLAAHRALRGSRLVTVEARTHAIFANFPSDCANRAVNRYLADGTLPGGDQHCTGS
ncbi:alpha/beta hydrolase [Amycolatopsis anabasis]|uniref:alpha/beta hydrolase n=1 Tax=Amycolatopsis anabasis TaxID=1840409 RepID=UPI00131E4D30|nr:alpha/beta hydrolase [Amycolatopsis anabasis]